MDRVNHTSAVQSVTCVDRETSNDICSHISSESSCSPRAVGADVPSTARAECGSRDEAGAFTVMGSWQGSIRCTVESFTVDVYWRTGAMLRLYILQALSVRSRVKPSEAEFPSALIPVDCLWTSLLEKLVIPDKAWCMLTEVIA